MILDKFPTIAVICKIIGGDHSHKNAFAGPGTGLEYSHFVTEFFSVFFADSKIILREFHLAEIDHIIVTIDQKIDLCAFICFGLGPTCVPGVDHLDPEGHFDLVDVFETNRLKAETAPGAIRALVEQL